jgi:hypothetical protein
VPNASTCLWIVLAVTLLLELWVLRRLRFDWFLVATVLAGTLVYANYLGYTSLAERNYDGPAHVEYIQSIAEQRRLPDVFACGACGHPPLYYALAALWSKVAAVGGWLPLELRLQWLSLLLFFSFVVFALLILRSRLERPVPLWMAAALVVFWPSSVLNSVRVHNDALAAPLMLASIYFILAWDEHGRARDFRAALATAALSLLTKSTGYAVAVTLLLFAVLRLRSTRWHRESVKQCAVAVLVLTTAAALAAGARESREPSTLCQKVLGHACGGRYVPPVADTPSRFLSFDAGDFLRRTDTMPDDPERDYFLNRLAKSSLFGVMPLGEELATTRHRALGIVMSASLLLMTAVGALSLSFLRGVNWRRYRVVVAAAAIMLAFLVAFRLRLPNPFHEDFRHIFPALVPLCLGYVAVVERLGRIHPLLQKAGMTIGLSMVASSVAFFVRIP